jgi:hypothetical protein
MLCHDLDPNHEGPRREGGAPCLALESPPELAREALSMSVGKICYPYFISITRGGSYISILRIDFTTRLYKSKEWKATILVSLSAYLLLGAYSDKLIRERIRRVKFRERERAREGKQKRTEQRWWQKRKD